MIDERGLRYPVRILTPGAGALAGMWVPLRRAWAAAEESAQRTIFSSVGLAARTILFTLRRQSLSPGDIIELGGQWHYVTELNPKERIFLQATTAVVTPVECRADVHKTAPGMAFQGILTEKYLRYEQEKPMATNTLTYVLVTPKTVELTRGGLVEVAGEPHVVQVAHTLDPAKNEYELWRKKDL